MANAAQVSRRTKAGSVTAVSLGNLRVFITQEGEREWYAQGIEIDYLAQGDSLEDVQRSFERGLELTITEHLKTLGDIKRLLRPAPAELWAEFFARGPDGRFRFSAVTIHELAVDVGDKVLAAHTTGPRKGKAAIVAPAPAPRLAQLGFDGVAYYQAAA